MLFNFPFFRIFKDLQTHKEYFPALDKSFHVRVLKGTDVPDLTVKSYPPHAQSSCIPGNLFDVSKSFTV